MKLFCWLVLLSIAVVPVAAQVESGQQAPDETTDSRGNGSAPADSAPDTDSQTAENPLPDKPAISYSDLPSERVSLLQLGLAFNWGVETTANGNSGNIGPITSTERANGQADLVKYWRHSVSTLDYLGTGAFYPSNAVQDHEFIASQRFIMGNKQLTVSDSFINSYGGSFGAASLGGGSLYNLISNPSGVNGTGGNDFSTLSDATTYGGIAHGSYLTNVARGVFTESLSRRSSGMLAAFYETGDYTGSSLLNSRQYSVAAQYSYVLSERDSLSVLYDFRGLSYPTSQRQSAADNLFSFSYQRRLNSRSSVSVGVGPEVANFTTRSQIPNVTPPLFLVTSTRQLNVSSFSQLNYEWGRTSLSLSYQRWVTGGSGLSAGANTDVIHASARRRVTKSWDGDLDAGFVRLGQVGASSASNTFSYHYWYAGGAARRYLTRDLSFLVSYQFNRQVSGSSTCVVRGVCGYSTQEALIGISWHARPIRLDRGDTFRQDASGASAAGRQD